MKTGKTTKTCICCSKPLTSALKGNYNICNQCIAEEVAARVSLQAIRFHARNEKPRPVAEEDDDGEG